MAERGQLGVEPLLAGQGDEGDPPGPALAGEPLEAVGEVGPAAEDADDHGAGLGQVVGDEAVEGLGLEEVVGVAGADGREAFGQPADGGGEGLDLGIGGREDQEHGGPRLGTPRAGRLGGRFGARARPRGRTRARRRRGRSDRARRRVRLPLRGIPRPPHPRRRLGRGRSGPSRVRPPSVVVSARSSGSRAFGASGLPTRRGRAVADRSEEASFPITAAGPRRFRTGFPSTGTVVRDPSWGAGPGGKSTANRGRDDDPSRAPRGLPVSILMRIFHNMGAGSSRAHSPPSDPRAPGGPARRGADMVPPGEIPRRVPAPSCSGTSKSTRPRVGSTWRDDGYPPTRPSWACRDPGPSPPRRGFLLKGGLDRESIRPAAQAVLVDPVVESYSIRTRLRPDRVGPGSPPTPPSWACPAPGRSPPAGGS